MSEHTPQEPQGPDDYGMLPPEQSPPTPEEPIFLPKPPTPFLPIYGHEMDQELINRLYQNIVNGPEKRLRQYNDLINIIPKYYGGLFEPTKETPAKPPEKRPAYPSRAGWRANYLPAVDEPDEVPKDKPKGKIGDYEIIETATTLDEIGGNIGAKDLLIEIAAQFEDPESYIKWDVPVPKGVLLYGVPGTGKTMLAKAFANTANAAFIEVPVATIRDPHYGVSEKKLKTLFDEAGKYKGQVVIFFDEIDQLLPDRSKLPPNHPDGLLVNTFLQAMDGMQSASNIMVMGATNFPNRLDGAATRPGRVDRKVEVELPDQAGCRDIAAKLLLSSERKTGRVLAEDNLDLTTIAIFMEGLSGAAIAEVLNRTKRTLAQTERAMRKPILASPELDSIDYANEERDALVITTNDITSTALAYRLKR
ncbi:MAG TPA: ATP-binding protein [Candidatus Saccharimonadales bacterium]